MKRKDVLRSNTVVRWAVACVGMAMCSSPVLAAVADGSFEFAHKPALDGAGYLIQPLNNVRASGNMAIETTDTLMLPGFPDVAGAGTNNANGTFSYNGPTTVAMGFIQGAGAGTGVAPHIASPFVNNMNFTVEGRFKVAGPTTTIANHTYFWFENNAFGSFHFLMGYGRQGSDGNGTLAVSTPTAAPNFASSQGNIPLVFDQFVKMRAVTESLGGGQGKVSTFIDLEDGSGWRTGPTITQTPSTTRDRGSLVGVCQLGAGCTADTQVIVDYIRWKAAVLPTTEALAAPVVLCGGDVSGSTSGVPDGTTDGADLAYLYNHWGTVPVGTLGDIAGTTGPDGVVDGADVGKVYNCWAQADGAPASVPEPASVGVFGLGLVSLLAARRRA